MARPRRQLDAKDRAILRHLRSDGRISITDLGRAVQLSSTPCTERLERLCTEGYIERFTISINESKANYVFFKYFFVKTKTQSSQDEETFEVHVKSMDHIIFCDSIEGIFDYIIKVGCLSEHHHSSLYREITSIPSVLRVRTLSRISEVKEYGVDIDWII